MCLPVFKYAICRSVFILFVKIGVVIVYFKKSMMYICLVGNEKSDMSVTSWFGNGCNDLPVLKFNL